MCLCLVSHVVENNSKKIFFKKTFGKTLMAVQPSKVKLAPSSNKGQKGFKKEEECVGGGMPMKTELLKLGHIKLWSH